MALNLGSGNTSLLYITSGGIPTRVPLQGATDDDVVLEFGKLTIQLGEAAGADYLEVDDSAGSPVFKVNSDGAGTMPMSGSTLTIAAKLVLAAGSITDADGAISFGDENLSTTGTLASGTHTVSSALVLASGSITDSSGAISFGNENLSTTGDLAAKDLILTGNLWVRGESHVIEGESVSFEDNNVVLNFGYTSDAAQAGGFVVNYDPTTTTDTVAADGFHAGVPATSNPYVTTTGEATFSTSDIIMISGTADSENYGIFEVLSHVGTTLTIRGIGLTACVEAFTSNQFATDTTTGANITKVAVSVLRAGTDGVWESGKGSTTGITFTDLATTANQTLQTAYNNGPTITTASSTAIAFTLTSGGFTVDGGGAVTFGGSTALSAFAVTATGSLDFTSTENLADAIYLRANGGTSETIRLHADQGTGDASIKLLSDVGGIDLAAGTKITLTATTNLLATGGSSAKFGDDVATLDFDGAGAVSESGMTSFSITPSGAITLTAGAASTWSTDGGALILSGKQGLKLQENGGDVLAINDSRAVSLTATGDSTLQTTSGNLAIATVTAGTLDLDSVGALSLNSSGAAINIGNDAAAQALNLGTGGARAITIGSAAAGSITADAGVGGFDLDCDTTFDLLSGGAFSIDGSGASNVSATSGNLTLSTITSGTLILLSAGSLTADCVALSLDGTDSSNLTITTNSGDDKTLTIAAVNSGAGKGIIVLDADDYTQLNSKVVVDTDSAYDLGTNGTRFKGFYGDSLIADIQVFNRTAGGVDYSDAASAPSENDVVYFSSANTIGKADADGAVAMRPVGCRAGVAGYVKRGVVTFSKETTNAVTVNAPLYLCSTDVTDHGAGTAGKVSAVAPTSVGSIVFQVGIATATAAGGGSTVEGIWMPQLVAVN
jgi:hypothetical protein